MSYPKVDIREGIFNRFEIYIPNGRDLLLGANNFYSYEGRHYFILLFKGGSLEQSSVREFITEAVDSELSFERLVSHVEDYRDIWFLYVSEVGKPFHVVIGLRHYNPDSPLFMDGGGVYTYGSFDEFMLFAGLLHRLGGSGSFVDYSNLNRSVVILDGEVISSVMVDVDSGVLEFVEEYGEFESDVLKAYKDSYKKFLFLNSLSFGDKDGLKDIADKFSD